MCATFNLTQTLLTHQTGSSHLTVGQAVWKHQEVFLLFADTQLKNRKRIIKIIENIMLLCKNPAVVFPFPLSLSLGHR